MAGNAAGVPRVGCVPFEKKPPRAVLILQNAGAERPLHFAAPAKNRKKKLQNRGEKMKKAIPISELKPITQIEIDVLRTIALNLGGKNKGFVPYNQIAKANNLDRDVVARAVKKMEKNRILKIEDGKLEILHVISI